MCLPAGLWPDESRLTKPLELSLSRLSEEALEGRIIHATEEKSEAEDETSCGRKELLHSSSQAQMGN